MTLDDLCLRYPDLKSGSDTLGDCLSYGIFGYIIDNVPDLDELTDEYVQSIITLMLRYIFYIFKIFHEGLYS